MIADLSEIAKARRSREYAYLKAHFQADDDLTDRGIGNLVVRQCNGVPSPALACLRFGLSGAGSRGGAG